jgi:hypothetical protein
VIASRKSAGSREASHDDALRGEWHLLPNEEEAQAKVTAAG